MFFVGEENYLDVTFTPNRSTYALIWESSNPEVITVSGSGRVKAIAPGAATIIIRTVNGKILASCAVNVLRTPETTSFNDVNTTNWFYPYVDFAAKYGLYYGISEGVFAPNMEMTRAMVVTVLHRMEGSPEPQNIDYFDDINVYQWYGASVCWAAENNIVLGHGNGLFAPEDKVTREQFALILQRYAEWKQFEIKSNYNLSAFADKSKVSPWAESAVKWAVGNKIINGKPSGYQTIIDPQGYTTRAEVAKMLSCFINEKYDFVKPTSVEASETEITMDAYTTYILSAKVYPEGALQKVIWDTYDANIISVDNGIVNALRPGTAEINIYAGEGLKANVKVNILPGNSEFTITFETIKTFITENGNYDSETESYYYGYEGENYVSYIEYFPESNYFAFIYEEYFEDDMCMRHSISITDRRSPYNVSLHVTQGESIYANGYAQINADTYTAFAEIPISSHYYYGPDEIDGKEFVYENTFLGTYYNLWCIDYILKNDIPEASLHALGFKQLVFEE